MIEVKKFLGDLYDRVKQGAGTDQKMEELGRFYPQRVLSWNYVPGSHPGQGGEIVGLELQRGIVLGKEGLIFALSLGKGIRHNYGSSLRLQFGGLYTSLPEGQPVTVGLLRGLVNNQPPLDCLIGEFFSDYHLSSVSMDCWADNERFGGRGIGRSPMWPQSRLLSPEGLTECLSIVKRTIEKGFVPPPEKNYSLFFSRRVEKDTDVSLR